MPHLVKRHAEKEEAQGQDRQHEREILGNAGTLGLRERRGYSVELPNHSSEQIEFPIPLTPLAPRISDV